NNLAQGALAPSPAPFLALSHTLIPADNPFNPFGIDLGQGAAGSPRVRTRFVDVGNRLFNSDYNYYRFVGGLRGEITPNYSYEAAYTYNRSDQQQRTVNAANGAPLNATLKPDL